VVPKTAISKDSSDKSDAHDALTSIQDSDLFKIIAAWPVLPERIKAAILKMVKGTNINIRSASFTLRFCHNYSHSENYFMLSQ
jgi:hypothetical protein